MTQKGRKVEGESSGARPLAREKVRDEERRHIESGIHESMRNNVKAEVARRCALEGLNSFSICEAEFY
jgi:hypothetical protein